MEGSIRAEFHDRWHAQRFEALKQDSMDRIDLEYMTHGAFVVMLMDVWEYHLENETEGFEPTLVLEEDGRPDRERIVRDTGVISNAQDA